jgi:hypothetical protein
VVGPSKDEARKAIAEAMAGNPTIVKFPAKPRPAPKPPHVTVDRGPASKPPPKPDTSNVVVYQVQKLLDALGYDALNEFGAKIIGIALNSLARQALSPKRRRVLRNPKLGWEYAAMRAFVDRWAPWADTARRFDMEFEAFKIDRPVFTKYDIGDAFGANIDKDIAAMIQELELPNIGIRDLDRETARKLANAQAVQRWRARQPRQCAAKGCCNLLKDKRANARFCSPVCRLKTHRQARE